jgi:hypothetical protein
MLSPTLIFFLIVVVDRLIVIRLIICFVSVARLYKEVGVKLELKNVA